MYTVIVTLIAVCCCDLAASANFTQPELKLGGWRPLPGKSSRVILDTRAKQGDSATNKQQRADFPIPVITPHAHGATIGFDLPEQGLTLYLDVDELATKPIAQNIGLKVVTHEQQPTSSNQQSSSLSQQSPSPSSSAPATTKVQPSSSPSSTKGFFSQPPASLSNSIPNNNNNNNNNNNGNGNGKNNGGSNMSQQQQRGQTGSQKAPTGKNYHVGYIRPADLHNALKHVGMNENQQKQQQQQVQQHQQLRNNYSPPLNMYKGMNNNNNKKFQQQRGFFPRPNFGNGGYYGGGGGNGNKPQKPRYNIPNPYGGGDSPSSGGGDSPSSGGGDSPSSGGGGDFGGSDNGGGDSGGSDAPSGGRPSSGPSPAGTRGGGGTRGRGPAGISTSTRSSQTSTVPEHFTPEPDAATFKPPRPPTSFNPRDRVTTTTTESSTQKQIEQEDQRDTFDEDEENESDQQVTQKPRRSRTSTTRRPGSFGGPQTRGRKPNKNLRDSGDGAANDDDDEEVIVVVSPDPKPATNGHQISANLVAPAPPSPPVDNTIIKPFPGNPSAAKDKAQSCSAACDGACAPNTQTVAREASTIREIAQALQADAILTAFPAIEEQLQNLVDFSTTGYTLFLPSNDALAKLPQNLMDKWKDDSDRLMQVVDNHVLDSSMTLEEMRIAKIIQPRAAKANLRVQATGPRNQTFTINGQRIAHANQAGPASSGGMIHVVDGLLYPTADKDIMDTLRACNRFDGFVTLSEGTGFADTLTTSGPFTVFVPSNEALQKVPDSDLEIIRNNMTALREFLMYHVAQGAFYSNNLRDGQFLATLLPGGRHPIQVGVRVDGCSRRLVEANVSPLYRADIPATNGVIHVVDWVLKPNDRDWCDGVILPR